MKRKLCKVCQHDLLLNIHRDANNGEPKSRLAIKYKICVSSVRRHFALNHIETERKHRSKKAKPAIQSAQKLITKLDEHEPEAHDPGPENVFTPMDANEQPETQPQIPQKRTQIGTYEQSILEAQNTVDEVERIVIKDSKYHNEKSGGACYGDTSKFLLAIAKQRNEIAANIRVAETMRIINGQSDTGNADYLYSLRCDITKEDMEHTYE